MRDLIILGGGPAALSAAVYARGKQLDVLLIYEELGGKATWRQNLVGQVGEEYLAGEEIVRSFERAIVLSGRALHDQVTAVAKPSDTFQVTTKHNGVQEALAVLVATGATPIQLDAPGGQEFLGQGLGYSVTTHAHLLHGKTVAVIGQTQRALRGTAEVAQTARQVYLIVVDASLPEDPLAEAIQWYPNVEILHHAQIREIAGGMNAEEVVIEQAGQTRRLAVDAAFVDLGLRPNTAPVRGLLGLDADTFIAVDNDHATAAPGLFAAGDVTANLSEHTMIAMGDGARAAVGAYDYILAARAMQGQRESI